MTPDWVEPAAFVAFAPLIGALLLAMISSPRTGSLVAIAASGAGLGFALMLPTQIGQGVFILVDPLSAHVAILTSFVGFT